MKQLTIIVGWLLLSVGIAQSQITLEQTYDHSGTYTRLSNSGDKFFIMHVGAEQCRIYNTDHTPWKTIVLDVPTNHWLYDIKYVSENLFTVDNSVCLAYVYYSYDEVGQYYTYTTNIIRDDGTILLTIPGCQYVLVHTMSDNSAKLTTFSYDYSLYPYTIQTGVYSLPGHLTSFAVEEHTQNSNLFKAFPNPSQTFTTIPYELPEDKQAGEICITNTEGVTLRCIPVNRNDDEITIETTSYPRGVYFYYLQAGAWRTTARKLVIN